MARSSWVKIRIIISSVYVRNHPIACPDSWLFLGRILIQQAQISHQRFGVSHFGDPKPCGSWRCRWSYNSDITVVNSLQGSVPAPSGECYQLLGPPSCFQGPVYLVIPTAGAPVAQLEGRIAVYWWIMFGQDFPSNGVKTEQHNSGQIHRVLGRSRAGCC